MVLLRACGTELTVRTLGKYKNIDGVKNIVVSNQNGRIVKLGDIASVRDGWEEETSYRS